VFCEATVRSRDDALNPDTILQGWTVRVEPGLSLHRYFHDGSYAEQLRVPAENVTPIGPIEAADAGRWSALSRFSSLRRIGRRFARRGHARGQRRHRWLRWRGAGRRSLAHDLLLN
jgi:hypothetical protein